MEDASKEKENFFELGPKLTTKVAGHGNIRMVTMMNQTPIQVGDAEFWVYTLVTKVGENGQLEIVSQIPHATLPAGYAFQDQLLGLIKLAEEQGRKAGVDSLSNVVKDCKEHIAELQAQLMEKIGDVKALEALVDKKDTKIDELQAELDALKNPAPKKKRGLGKQK